MHIRKILVCGATGQQGAAVINALLASTVPYQIVALTRDPTSPASQSLAAKSKNITLLRGDFNDCVDIFQRAGEPGSVHGVFSVQIPAFSQKGVPDDIEQTQGSNLVDAAIAAGVRHFIYSSVDRGGNNSASNPTNVPHFISKHLVEKYLIATVNDANKNSFNMTYTILRPTAFYENLTPDMKGKGFAAMWSNMGKALQLVATRDVGIFASLAFTSPESFTYRNNAISLAGDEITQAQGSENFKKVFGREMPKSLSLVGHLVQFIVKELGTMFKWFADVGYKANLSECRKLNPSMQSFETWLREESKFKY